MQVVHDGCGQKISSLFIYSSKLFLKHSGWVRSYQGSYTVAEKSDCIQVILTMIEKDKCH